MPDVPQPTSLPTTVRLRRTWCLRLLRLCISRQETARQCSGTSPFTSVSLEAPECELPFVQHGTRSADDSMHATPAWAKLTLRAIPELKVLSPQSNGTLRNPRKTAEFCGGNAAGAALVNACPASVMSRLRRRYLCLHLLSLWQVTRAACVRVPAPSTSRIQPPTQRPC